MVNSDANNIFQNTADERINIPITEIHDFPNHPYQVKDDDSMTDLVDSIKTYGLIQPVLVRRLDDNSYEMISGHRRKRAFELAEIETIPAVIYEITRDEAILMMLDSNLHREEILPSEKAKAYKMRLDVMKRQGERTDLTSTPVESKSRSNEQLGDVVGESREQIRRYIRLNELIPELLALVDEKRIALRPAVELSYLPKEAQQWLNEAINYTFATPSHVQAIKMRKFFNEGKLTQEVVDSIMEEEKPNQRERSAFRDERIAKLIPRSVPVERQSDYVIKALEHYNRFLARKREQQNR